MRKPAFCIFLWPLYSDIIFFIDHDCAGVSNKHCLLLFFIFKHLYIFLHANDLIYKNQSGFLPGHSTVYQLLDINHQICQSIDVKQHMCMIFCDISKAFNRVWHKGLLFKLRQNGITGDLLHWVSYVK